MEQRKLIITDIVLVILGLVLIVIGCALFPVVNMKIKDTVEQNVKLVSGSEGFKAWKEPQAPIYVTHYFFNVTNPDEIIYNNSKPRLQEIGPFTYREYRYKTDIDFMEDGDRIHYKEQRYYFFEANQSAELNESVVICTVNIPVLTVATRLRFYNYFFQFVLREFFKTTGERLFQCLSVKELLWGYTPVFVEKLAAFLKKWLIPYELKFTFGIYFGPMANGTGTGDLEIFTGVKDVKKLGLVEKWKGSSSLSYWYDSCNNISGSDGTLWHPFVEKTDTLYILNTDICRSLYVTYNSSSTVSSSNITTYHFTPSPTFMGDPRTYSANKCYCLPYDYDGAFCLGAGVLNVASCKEDAPIIISKPHFLDAPEYIDEVIGLNPDPKKHQIVIDVEPTTGLVLNVAKIIQINVYITRLDGFSDTDKFTAGLIFPILWLDEHATIPDDVAAKFYHTVILPIKVANWIPYGFIALGGFVMLCALVLLIVICAKRRSNKMNHTDRSNGKNCQPTKDSKEPTRAADADEPLSTG